MEARLRIDALLRELLKNSCGRVNLYYQPPAGYQLRYPCIVYTQSRIQNGHANNGVYIQHSFYTVTVIDTDPDSKIVQAVSVLGKCRYDRHFITDNLYHTTFTLYT